jgi:N-methylhydantoinase B/oxoprolinase/acetone carboxylase alpha subunit
VGQKRFCELVDDYGLDVVMDTGRALLDYSERLLRSQIEKIPDGVYEAEQYSDSDGKNLDTVLPIKVKVTIRGSEIEFDMTGSADQVTTARNVPFAGSTCTSLWFICKAIFTDQATFQGFLPNNGGVFRPIKIHAPLGCIFNPRFPAACNDRFNQIDILVDSVIKALSPVIPLCAGTTCVALFPSYSGIHPKTENYWVYLEVEEGAYGGSPFRDGMSAVDVLVANTQNSPIEHIEMEYPLRVNRYEMNVDKTGAGKRRGGFAVIRNTEFLAPGMITALGDRSKQRPWGYDGGKEGCPQVLTKVKANGERILLPSACEAVPFDTGDSFELETASGGGYGNPLEREPELVLKDLLDELINERTVREEYGVVIRNNAIDEEATQQLRAKMSRAS